MTVRFTPTARAEFLAVVEYIRRDKPGAAVQFRRKAEQGLRRLVKFPDLPFREVVVAPYRFFYRLEDKTVWVVAVWHGAQRPREPQA